MRHTAILPIFRWLWSSSCQMKHKVFFWLLLNDRLNTRGLLRRKNMVLESYSCDLCILQREETLGHLFLRCNFARACWASIGLLVPRTLTPMQIFRSFKRQLAISFYMEVIILIAWSIWTVRNNWIFNDIDPTVLACISLSTNLPQWFFMQRRFISLV